MTEIATSTESREDAHAIEELLRVLGKTQRALQMYLPNNPVYQRGLQQLIEAFPPVWAITDQLALDIHEDRITWNDVTVLQQPARGEGLAWQLYKDGLRRLVLMPGVEGEEIIRLLQVIHRSRMLPTGSTDDLLTLLWEQEFGCVTYTFIEAAGEGGDFLDDGGAFEIGHGGGGGGRGGGTGDGAGTGGGFGGAQAEVAAGRAAAAGSEEGVGGGHGIVDMADFDAALYFLDEAEIRQLRAELDDEYKRDIRQAAIDALLDTLESQRSPDVRREVIALLEDILPTQLAIGGFRAVARILRELRVVAGRAEALDADLRVMVLSFEERLSTPEILDQLFRVLTDTTIRPADDDVGEVLRELKPAALPVVLRQLSRPIDAGVRRVLEATVELLARTQPQVLGDLVAQGEEDIVIPAIGTAARLGLTQLVPAIVTHLRSPDESVRIVSVRALGELGTPTAVSAIESAIDDPERGVRQAALTWLMARGGSGGLRARLEALLFGDHERVFERSELRMLFEAYGTIAGHDATLRLSELAAPRGFFRRKLSPDVRASALYALAKVGGNEARALVEGISGDKDPVIRSAANSVLRDWPT